MSNEPDAETARAFDAVLKAWSASAPPGVPIGTIQPGATVLGKDIPEVTQEQRDYRHLTGLERLLEAEDLVEVLGKDGSSRYEWSEFGSWYSPSRRRFFWHSDSGCSCGMYGERVDTLADLEDGDRDALMRAYKRWAEEDSNEASDVRDLTWIGESTIRRFRPGKE